MRIAIMSDSHENWQKLAEAIAKANSEQCKHLLFAGDLISPQGITMLEKFNGEVTMVWGNNEGEKVGILNKLKNADNITMAGDVYEGELGETKVFMNHYPRLAELAAQSGKYDLVIHGHDHQIREENVGDTLLINPGEIQGHLSGKSTFGIYNTNEKEFSLTELT